MRHRSAFTLIDTLITMAIISVLAGIVYPLMADVSDLGISTDMTTAVNQIRRQINYHAAIGDELMSKEGYPNMVHPSWFATGRLPNDCWTHRPLFIQTVHGPEDARTPNKMSFNIRPDGEAAGHTAWYNAANGSFCVFVPKKGSNQEIEALFNLVNNL